MSESVSWRGLDKLESSEEKTAVGEVVSFTSDFRGETGDTGLSFRLCGTSLGETATLSSFWRSVPWAELVTAGRGFGERMRSLTCWLRWSPFTDSVKLVCLLFSQDKWASTAAFVRSCSRCFFCCSITSLPTISIMQLKIPLGYVKCFPAEGITTLTKWPSNLLQYSSNLGFHGV